jgi:hypothetical protein
MPAMPGARLAVIEAEIAFGALETFLDRPAQAGDAGKLGERSVGGSEDETIGALVGLGRRAADQQPMGEVRVRTPYEPQSSPVI